MAMEPRRRFQRAKEVAQALLPIFKKGPLAFQSTEAEVSLAGQSGAVRPVTDVVSALISTGGFANDPFGPELIAVPAIKSHRGTLPAVYRWRGHSASVLERGS